MRKFGIEIEARLSNGNDTLGVVRDAVSAAGLSVRVSGHGSENYRFWQVQTDGSLPGASSFELVSPPLTGFEDLEKACAALATVGAEVPSNASGTAYGLHVHFDATDLTLQQVAAIALAYDSVQSDINAMLPPSRMNNRYCLPLSAVDASRGMSNLVPLFARLAAGETLPVSSMNTIFGGASASTHYDNHRYRTVNVQRFLRANNPANRTIEFRNHFGSVDFGKIKNWVVILSTLITSTLAKLELATKTTATRAPVNGIVPTDHTRANAPRVVRGGTKVVQFIERCKAGTATFEWCQTELDWSRDTAQSWASYVRAWGFPLKSIKLGRTVLGYTMENVATVQSRLNAGNAAAVLKHDLKSGLPADVAAYIDDRKARMARRATR